MPTVVRPPDGPVGLDVEQVRALADVAALAGHVHSPAELARSRAPEPAAFFRTWTRKEALLKADGWNEFVITAKGSHVTIELNGTQIIDRDDPKFDKEGIIGLQIHVWPEPMEVRYKDLEIQEL